MTPTKIYVNAVRHIQKHYRVKQVLHGIAHITGGGIEENLDRILPPHVDAVVDPTSWDRPPIFDYLQSLGDIPEAEMRRVFNNGIGLALVVSDYYADAILDRLSEPQLGITATRIGKISEGTGVVRYNG